MGGELALKRTTDEDLSRTVEILTKYADSRIDFVNWVIAAMAERLKIETILTVDRRHLQLFRPRHCLHFHILPE
jgi:predicted nucleic acid-binding protein